MRPRVVDTSVLYALFDADQPGHGVAKAKMDEDGPIVIPGEIAVELHGVLVAKAGRARAKQGLDALRALRRTEWIHQTDVLGAFDIRQRHAGLSLADAVAVAHAVQLGCDLDTFDQAQRRAWQAER